LRSDWHELLEDGTAHRAVVSAAEFINTKLTAKLMRQTQVGMHAFNICVSGLLDKSPLQPSLLSHALRIPYFVQDPLTVTSQTFPEWCTALMAGVLTNTMKHTPSDIKRWGNGS
jgi:hypothetical protein